ncbi:MAG: 30S ribosomal protein S7 [Gammaproteobacteria bacterium]|nr:30S ribosomal protein S7 [Gammaproteobacteria bacterium]MCH9743378.1 30S ribosomal protein S7 [Gammaproteobacteria bacterium]
MSRRKAAPKRAILPDPLFKSELLAKFINSVMSHGKKSVAENIVYGALDSVFNKVQQSGGKMLKDVRSPRERSFKDKEGDDGGEGGDGGSSFKPIKGDIRDNDDARGAALSYFKRALDNVMPTVEVKSRRVGGSTYQVPVEIRSTRRMALAMRWLVEYSSKRGEKTMEQRLANEILDAIENRGAAVKKREDVHRMAEANRAFAHYRW